METTTLTFKTSLNCGNCVAKIQPALEQANGIVSWQVDTQNPDKILTVESDGISTQEIINLVESKGFTIQSI